MGVEVRAWWSDLAPFSGLASDWGDPRHRCLKRSCGLESPVRPEGARKGWLYVGQADRPEATLPSSFRVHSSLAIPGGHRTGEELEEVQRVLARCFSLDADADPGKNGKPVEVSRHLGYRDLVAEINIGGHHDRHVAAGLASFAGLRPDVVAALGSTPLSTESSLSICIGGSGLETTGDGGAWGPPGEGGDRQEQSEPHLTTATPGLDQWQGLLARWDALTVRLAGPPSHQEPERPVGRDPRQELDATVRRLVAATLDELERSVAELPALWELMPAALALIELAEQCSKADAPFTVRPLLSHQVAKWVAGLRRRLLEQTERPDPLVPTRRASRGADQPLGPGFPRLALSRWLQEAMHLVHPHVCPLVRWTVDQAPSALPLGGAGDDLPHGLLLRCPMRLWWTPFQWPLALGSISAAVMDLLSLSQLAEAVHERMEPDTSGQVSVALDALVRIHDAVVSVPGLEPDSIGAAVSSLCGSVADAFAAPNDKVAFVSASEVQAALDSVARYAFTFGLSGISTAGVSWFSVGPVLAHEAIRGNQAIRHRHDGTQVFRSLGGVYATLLMIDLLEQLTEPACAALPSPELLLSLLGRATASPAEGTAASTRQVRELVAGLRLDRQREQSLAGPLSALLQSSVAALNADHRVHWDALMKVIRGLHDYGAALYASQAPPQGALPAESHALQLHVAFLTKMKRRRTTRDIDPDDRKRVVEAGALPLIPDPVYGLDSRMFLASSHRDNDPLRQFYHSHAIELMAELGERLRRPAPPRGEE